MVLNPSEKWTIVNDIDPNSLEVSEEIQGIYLNKVIDDCGSVKFLKTRILVVINTPRHYFERMTHQWVENFMF